MIDLNKLKSYNLKNIDGKLTDKKVIKAKFRLLKLFSQKHNIIIHIRELNTRIDHFRKLAKKIIPINNRTR